MISDAERTLGQALIAANLMGEDDFSAAINAVADNQSPSLIIYLLKSEFLSFKTFQKFLEQNFKIRTVILSDREIQDDLVDLVGRDLISQKFLMPVIAKTVDGSRKLALGMVNPLDEAVVAEVQRRTQSEVTPLLISLPDFQDTVSKLQKFDKMGDRTAIASYEEQLVKLEQLNYDKPADLSPLEMAPTPSKNQPALSVNPKGVEYFGQGIKKFREELIVKLNLDQFEISALQKEAYLIGDLFEELAKMKKSTLENSFDTLDADGKFVALANSLIHKGVLTKHDILVAGGIAKVLGKG